jgi:hypothetical protein
MLRLTFKQPGGFDLHDLSVKIIRNAIRLHTLLDVPHV